MSGGKFEKPLGATKYTEVDSEEFKQLVIWTVQGLPIHDIHVKEEQAILGANKSEEILIITATTKEGRRIMFKCFTGFDPVRKSRYGDAMRIVGFYEVSEGKFVPYGSAVAYKTRTYHTKGWKENLQKRLAKTLHDLEERTKKVKTLHDHIVTEVGSLPWQDVLKINNNADGTVDVSFAKFVNDPKQFNKMISALKAIGLRYDPQKRVWHG